MSFNVIAAITFCSDFGAQENKFCHCSHFIPFYLPWSDGTRCHDLTFLNVDCQARFFTLIKRLFSSSLVSPIKVVSSAYLRLLMFLLAIFSPPSDSSSPAFHMTYSAYKLNRQATINSLLVLLPQVGNSQFFHVQFCFISWPTYRYLRRQVRWSSIPISLRIFHSLLWSTQSMVLA